MQAYLYAYPLVLMEQTRAATPGLALNRFVHAEAYPGPDARTVVRPNVDTLYSTAWLDLSRGPPAARWAAGTCGGNHALALRQRQAGRRGAARQPDPGHLGNRGQEALVATPLPPHFD